MNAYEAKIAAKKERMEDRAERLATEAQATYARAHKMAEVIPFGQPILVGHHSERRDRNYRATIHNTYGKAFATQKAAEELAGRAASVGTAGVSSDDPDAIEKLREKLAGMEAEQERMKAYNVAWRKAGNKAGRQADGTWVNPPYTYELTNNSGNMGRVKDRIATLERNAKRANKTTELEGDIRVVENADENRLQIFFPGKPSEGTRTELKQNGFRWAPTEGAWQRQLSNGAVWAASRVLKNGAEPFDPKQPYGSTTKSVS